MTHSHTAAAIRTFAFRAGCASPSSSKSLSSDSWYLMTARLRRPPLRGDASFEDGAAEFSAAADVLGVDADVAVSGVNEGAGTGSGFAAAVGGVGSGVVSGGVSGLAVAFAFGSPAAGDFLASLGEGGGGWGE